MRTVHCSVGVKSFGGADIMLNELAARLQKYARFLRQFRD